MFLKYKRSILGEKPTHALYLLASYALQYFDV